MIHQQRVVAVIPARGGSKGIPKKNLVKVGTYSLLERTILLAKYCADCVDQVLVTTDDPQMQEVSQKHGVAAPTLRPKHLSEDLARSIDVLIHIIEQCHLENDYILMLQPTSPLRTRADLCAVVGLLEKNTQTCDAVVSVADLYTTHPDKVQTISQGYLRPYIPGVSSERPRQELPKAYRLNGAFYLTHASMILKQRTLLPPRTLPYIMPEERSANIDHAWDLILLEALLAKGIVKLEEYPQHRP